MDFHAFFSKTSSIEHTDHPYFRVPGLTFSEKPYFQEIIPQLAKWGQNVLLLGQSNAGKSYFLKRLLSIVKPKRLVVISNTSANQYRQDGMDLKHYSTMPESIDETSIKPESYVVIDDIRVMGLTFFLPTFPCGNMILKVDFDRFLALHDCVKTFFF